MGSTVDEPETTTDHPGRLRHPATTAAGRVGAYAGLGPTSGCGRFLGRGLRRVRAVVVAAAAAATSVKAMAPPSSRVAQMSSRAGSPSIFGNAADRRSRVSGADGPDGRQVNGRRRILELVSGWTPVPATPRRRGSGRRSRRRAGRRDGLASSGGSQASSSTSWLGSNVEVAVVRELHRPVADDLGAAPHRVVDLTQVGTQPAAQPVSSWTSRCRPDRRRPRPTLPLGRVQSS